jgi:hypothetical protein
MPALTFQIEDAAAVPYAAAPLLNFKTRITCAGADVQIQNIILQCQIQIEPARRRYVAAEQDKLRDMFGAPSRWSQTLHPLLWANLSVVAPRFTGECVVDLQVPCTFDFNVATTKYLYGLEAGDVPVCVMFSGTVFHMTADGSLQVEQIPWDRESNYRLPVRVWKEMMDMHYPNSAWLCLQKDAFDRIYRYKIERGIPTFEQAIESIVSSAEENDLRKAAV